MSIIIRATGRDLDPGPVYERLIRPGLGAEPGPAEIFGRYRSYCRMIEGRQMPPVVNCGIAHAEGRRPDVACAVHPVRIGGRGRGCPKVDVNVGAVSMFNQTAIKNIRALVHSNICLRMNTKM